MIDDSAKTEHQQLGEDEAEALAQLLLGPTSTPDQPTATELPEAGALFRASRPEKTIELETGDSLFGPVIDVRDDITIIEAEQVPLFVPSTNGASCETTGGNGASRSASAETTDRADRVFPARPANGSAAPLTLPDEAEDESVLFPVSPEVETKTDPDRPALFGGTTATARVADDTNATRSVPFVPVDDDTDNRGRRVAIVGLLAFLFGVFVLFLVLNAGDEAPTTDVVPSTAVSTPTSAAEATAVPTTAVPTTTAEPSTTATIQATTEESVTTAVPTTAAPAPTSPPTTGRPATTRRPATTAAPATAAPTTPAPTTAPEPEVTFAPPTWTATTAAPATTSAAAAAPADSDE